MSQSKLNTFQRVRDLEGWQAVVFATALVERMWPNYQLFGEVTEQGEPEQFRKTLNSVWEWLTTPKAKINFRVQLEKIEEVTPDAADFDGYGVFPAIDAAISLAAVLSLILEDDPQGAVVVSKLSQGCVESFVEATAEEELDMQQIKAHPLMQWEIDLQLALLDTLEQGTRSKSLALQCKGLATEEGVSNIGIEM